LPGGPLGSRTPDEAEALLKAALARAGAAGDDRGRAAELRVQGFAGLLRNDPDAAAASLQRLPDPETLPHASAALFAELGDRGGLGWAMGLLAFTRFHLGYPEEAESMAEGVFGAAGEGGARWAAGMGQVLTATIRLWTGRAESAAERARQALATF